jgi:hypothetical protein
MCSAQQIATTSRKEKAMSDSAASKGSPAIRVGLARLNSLSGRWQSFRKGQEIADSEAPLIMIPDSAIALASP